VAQLNPSQRRAVEHTLGPLLVLAGAGSGKTRVITERIRRLVETGVPPSRILAVSFTNKAAAEMAERMIPLVGRERAERLWLSTFHSFGVRFLHEDVKALGYEDRFVIFDQGDGIGLVKDLIRREGLADRSMDTAAILSRISLYKNAFLAPHQVKESAHEYDQVARLVYPHYEADLRRMRALDFDDLVVAPVRVLRERDDLRAKWQERFDYLMIDEFQDTNRAQLELVLALTGRERNVCVVGDDDQSIYGWRGAEVGNILEFERHYPGAEVVKLEENYRSRESILAVANAAIAQSRGKRHEKTLRATRKGGERVFMGTADDPASEARMVASQIRELFKEGIRPRDVAILYRSNTQARLIEEELRAEGIGYRMFGGTQFFDRKEVKDVLAYLRLLVHPRDELSLRRIVNYPPRGLGDVSLTRIEGFAAKKGVTMLDALGQATAIDGLPEASKRSALAFHRAIRAARAAIATGKGAQSAARQLLEEVGLGVDFEASEDREAEMRRKNRLHVLRSLERLESSGPVDLRELAAYLQKLGLRVEEKREDDANLVTLSSLHSAKGLEFDVVFLIGCVEGILPHKRTTDPKATEAAPTDVEEERRLFYVGVTRARERLYISRPIRRSLRGTVTPLTPSRFLDGLPDEAWQVWDDPSKAQMSFAEIEAMADEVLAKLAN
jgi:superfamily I DNA/RNA helicase